MHSNDFAYKKLQAEIFGYFLVFFYVTFKGFCGPTIINTSTLFYILLVCVRFLLLFDWPLTRLKANQEILLNFSAVDPRCKTDNDSFTTNVKKFLVFNKKLTSKFIHKISFNAKIYTSFLKIRKFKIRQKHFCSLQRTPINAGNHKKSCVLVYS